MRDIELYKAIQEGQAKLPFYPEEEERTVQR